MVWPTSRKAREKRGWEGEREITCGYKGWGVSGPLNTKILGIDLQNYPHLKLYCQNPFYLYILFYKVWGFTVVGFQKYRFMFSTH